MTRLVPCLLLALTACRTTAPAPTEAPDAGPVGPADAGQRSGPVGPARPPTDPEALAPPTAEDLPGYPLDEVLSSTARQVLAFARDNFSYDGCPTPLDQCLRDPRYQRHALRALDLATRLLSEGRTPTQAGELLNRYYASFAPAGRAALALDKVPCRGPDEAKVTVVEFSDFECPACLAAKPLLEALVTSAGLVRLCYKPFPLNVHPHAVPAAQAALFARDHDRFWEMHDLLFAHQDALEGERLADYAESLDLPRAELIRALANNTYAPEVEASREEGRRLGLKGTPSLFLNGRPLILPLSPDFLSAALRDELEFASHGGRFLPDAR